MSHSLDQSPEQALIQALAELAQTRHRLKLLEEAYHLQQQRIDAHLERAQLLSEALASERATRLSTQADVAELQRHVRQLEHELTVAQEPLQERAVGA